MIDLSLARRPGRYPPGVGTWCNLAPEQARGDVLGSAADVWGLGTVLYEAVTGRAAFDDDESWTDDASEAPSGSHHTWDTADQRAAGYPQLAGPPPPVGSHRGDLPDGLATAIDACHAPAPADRPARDELVALLLPHALQG